MGWEGLEEKYADVELQRLDPQAIEDEEECAFLVNRLDAALAQATEDLLVMRSRAAARNEWVDVDVHAAATRLVKDLRRIRNGMQDRRGVVARSARHEKGVRYEGAFIRQAKRLLPDADYAAIVRAARRECGLEPEAGA